MLVIELLAAPAIVTLLAWLVEHRPRRIAQQRKLRQLLTQVIERPDGSC